MRSRSRGATAVAATSACTAKIASAATTAVIPTTGGGPVRQQRRADGRAEQDERERDRREHGDAAVVGQRGGAVEDVTETRQRRERDDGDGGDEGVVGERVLGGGVRERGAEDETDGGKSHCHAPMFDPASDGPLGSRHGYDTHLARTFGVPRRHPERQAHLRRSVPEREPEVPREREGAGARRRDLHHPRPQRPRRRHARPGEEVPVPGRRAGRAPRLPLHAGLRGRRRARPEQGRHGRPRRDQGHARARAALVELHDRRAGGLADGSGRSSTPASRADSSSTSARGRSSTSPATRTSSATWR